VCVSVCNVAIKMSDLNRNSSGQTDFGTTFHRNLFSGSGAVLCLQTDGQSDVLGDYLQGCG
jgi:hypothetical protein